MHRINVDLPEPVTSIRYSLLTIRPFAFNARRHAADRSPELDRRKIGGENARRLFGLP
jgi:hypothetical protein